MSVAIIISTHGAAAKPLLQTAEMILGQQNNVSWIDFFSGENTETLIEKYIACLANLNTKAGVLFLVDTWGGSPFNAASQIVIHKDNHEVITGVNIPMLIETFMARDDNLPFQKLVEIALENGRTGVKRLKSLNVTQTTSSTIQPIKKTNHSTQKLDNHMIISLARIDDRLIHGQVVTRWTKETKIKRIIVVSDDVAADKIRKTLLMQVAPPGITAHVVDVEKAIRVYNNPKYANERVMLLFTNPNDVVRLVEGGVILTSVNVGGMAFRKGKTQVNNAVSVDEQDVSAFKKLNKFGIELEVRKVSSDARINMMDLIKN
ncbi:PTS system, mannose/fructose/sorbose family, IIB component [secondary endosymbiont of Heteropsylla cubana]|uniref:PTS system mannose-specific EIIAB component n=1 Tax=secondary endosymbiont of Heteropsylla cubana TaxID=134287 RepID=J3VUG8_9ENTR|nr:PTS mannose transporter subunit IIAB [secondary endosymbiont of Heteropsylla cubana]AFP85806.1 PTS system, mannose/fructose/sorbose family, IIB component [secondary endosymbiont of Heteropsylla cubana]